MKSTTLIGYDLDVVDVENEDGVVQSRTLVIASHATEDGATGLRPAELFQIALSLDVAEQLGAKLAGLSTSIEIPRIDLPRGFDPTRNGGS